MSSCDVNTLVEGQNSAEKGRCIMLKKLFGLTVASHLEKAEKYEKIGKLGMARLELEQALGSVGLEDTAQREKLHSALDRIQVKEQEDA